MKSSNLKIEEIKRLKQYNLEEKLFNRYLNVLDNFNSKTRSIILDYLRPVEVYIKDDKYKYYISKFKRAFYNKIDIIEYGINNVEVINKLYYIKLLLIENPVVNVNSADKIYEYFNKYCKTLISKTNINNDLVRQTIIELINTYVIKESKLISLINEI